jgi:hypothetical protein
MLRGAAQGALLLRPKRRSTLTLAMLAALAVAPVVVLAAVTPRALVLPILCVAAIAVAALAALLAWARKARGRDENTAIWDVAGAGAFIACAAAMLSNPMHVVQLFGLAMTAE